jgi:hypothetical protein
MNAAHLRELMELGLAAEVLVRVAEIIDEETWTVLGQSKDKSSDIRGGPLESTAERTRKERDKTRKRAERAADKAAKLSAFSSMDASSDSPNASLTLEDKKEGLPVKEERKKGSRLLSDARVSNEQKLIAIEHGCPPDRVDAVWTEFVDYWSDIPGQRGLKLTWTGTWRNWVKRIFGKGKNGNATGNQRTDPAAGRATAREAEQIAAMGRGAAKRLAARTATGSEDGDPPRGAGSSEIFNIGKRTENAY